MGLAKNPIALARFIRLNTTLGEYCAWVAGYSRAKRMEKLATQN